MDKRTLDDILQATSDALFPADIGKRAVAIDSVASDGDTPLHVMVRRGDLPAVRVLLAAGARADAAGDMGETPLHVAVSVDAPAIAEALLAHGADPDRRCEFGDTPRERARARGGAVARAFPGTKR